MAFDFDLGSAFGGLVSGIGSLFGGSEAADNAAKLQEKNIEAQREFAQNGVRWRVADAKAAGIHPLYALGATTPTFSPVSGYTGDYGISEAARSFGQGIDRAVQVGMTKQEREESKARQEMIDVFRLAEAQDKVRETDANIRLADSQIALNIANAKRALAMSAPSPAMPSRSSLMPGQGDSPSAPKVTNPNLKDPVNEFTFEVDPNGILSSVLPSQDMASLTEDKLIVEWLPFLAAFLRDKQAKWLGRPLGNYHWNGDKYGYEPFKRNFDGSVQGKIR